MSQANANASGSATLGVIGGGNMGRAIVEGAIRAKVLVPEQIVVAEIDAGRRAAIVATGCRVTGDPAVVSESDQILLAVKPQNFPDVAGAIGPLRRPTIVISIMAGLSTASIRRSLGDSARVLRVMPNMPCRIGEGMTAIAPGAGSLPGDEDLARSLFEALGSTVIVDEKLMNAVTAVSGSGPAYVFLLAESMERAATDLGLDAATARVLVRQTILGSAKLLRDAREEAVELRQSVTSPGGTTEAALRVMYEGKLPQTIVAALTAARDRGSQLERS